MGKFAITTIMMGFLLLFLCAGVTEAVYMKYKDPKQPLNVRIRDLMNRMSLEEKIGQMTQIERHLAAPNIMKKYFIGSVLSLGGSEPAPKATAADWVKMVNEIQKGSLSTRLGIPMIYGIDAVHGHNNVYKATIFPHNVGLGVIRTKVAACAKHFVGDGGTVKGIDENNTVISANELLSIHMPAYVDSIIKGVSTVMISYSSWNGMKMHANRDLITGFLKGKLKFRGFVISDWNGIDKITDPPHANYSYSIQAGVLAGIDMIMGPENVTEFLDDLAFQVRNNIIPMSRIDDAVKRILRVKFVMGLFENPLADLSLANQLGSQEHRELAREAVRKSLVLLKNGKVISQPLIPLPKKVAKILVAGSHADNLGYQCGGWTRSWQGIGGNDLTTGTTILTAVKNTVHPSTQVVYRDNPDVNFVTSNHFSYAIVVVGETPYAETFGDGANLTIPEPGLSTITNVCRVVKCVVVVISGRPVVVEPYLANIDALVAAWLPGSEGQGVADILFGDYGFTGKLARTWFKSVDQLPMNVGDPHYDPLFPFGFGLTTEPVKS
ncbi:uncharacterized protein LOC107765533 isoform X2 [Nicotiana tabacum]|uniref:Beta-glucosidase BoGH3B isoform X2 n=1 Tax=Nicotiana tabacum TaxID=4097 RepID=A0A1S3XIK5_TOBAC|nr:beta-glucosidase BoGH3B-like isoform X2 [Nicotiana tomentosiformis]XP_016439684.1 PREDICTED: beta-glucosidase BoGH3B-like isoform X2 [Nicotiana tabacum]